MFPPNQSVKKNNSSLSDKCPMLLPRQLTQRHYVPQSFNPLHFTPPLKFKSKNQVIDNKNGCHSSIFNNLYFLKEEEIDDDDDEYDDGGFFF